MVYFPFTELVKMPVSEERIKCLNDNRVTLINRMTLDVLWPHLLQTRAISEEMQDEIKVGSAQYIRSAKPSNTDE